MTGWTGDGELPERAREVLLALVREHVRTGSPVSSAALLGHLSERWSSATVRNDLALLEERGFVVKAHSAAGREPTVLAYREYAQRALRNLRLRQLQTLDVELGHADLAVQLRSVGALLASRSSLVGLVLSIGCARSALQHMELVPLGPRRVLAVVATRSRAVLNRQLDLDFDVDRASLERFNNYFNAHWRGLPLEQVRERVRAELEHTREHVDDWLERMLSLAARVLEAPDAGGEVYIEGRQQLLDTGEFTEVQQIRALLDALEHRQIWLGVLDKTLENPGIVVQIGQDELQGTAVDCALITAPFSNQDGLQGRLGVLGPVRMDYPRVMALVHGAARAFEGQLR